QRQCDEDSCGSHISPDYGPLPEQERSKFVQVPAPGQPLMGSAGRFVVDVLDAGFVERLVKAKDVRIGIALHRTRANEQHLHLLVASSGSFVDLVDLSLRQPGAEAADVSKLIEVCERGE